MSIAALDGRRLTLIALVPDDRASLLSRFLQIPGLGDAHHIAVRGDTVAQRTALAARIDAAVLEANRAVMLVAQETACMAAAWWARLSPKSYIANVSGALMIAPDGRHCAELRFASPRVALPFPSIAIGNDDQTQRLGCEWGSRLIDAPLAIGGDGPTNRLRTMISRFTAAIVERDVGSAERLIRAIGDN